MQSCVWCIAEAMQAGRAQGGPGSESAGRASVSLALLSTIMTVSEPHASSTEPAEVLSMLVHFGHMLR